MWQVAKDDDSEKQHRRYRNGFPEYGWKSSRCQANNYGKYHNSRIAVGFMAFFNHYVSLPHERAFLVY
jgi:hypothetical protein